MRREGGIEGDEEGGRERGGGRVHVTNFNYL